MDDRWMIGVLGDLRAFADLNGMYELSDKISEAEELARMTLARQAEQGGAMMIPDAASVRNVH